MIQTEKDFLAVQIEIEREDGETPNTVEEGAIVSSLRSFIFRPGAACPPELTPGDSPMGSLEMSIGDLEQEELCGVSRVPSRPRTPA